MIFDCFTFFNELDLLEIRLNVLKDVVDKFVLVESTRTFTGMPKPLFFAENAARFAEFADRIVHVTVEDFPECPTPWHRESHQRNQIARGLLMACARREDTVMISDVDEIPDPVKVRQLASVPGVKGFDQAYYCYYLNFLNVRRQRWIGTKMLSYGDFQTIFDGVEVFRNEFLPESVNAGTTASKIRMRPIPRARGGCRIVACGGWHFTSLGGAEALAAKMRSFSHQEYNSGDRKADPEELRRLILSGSGPFWKVNCFAVPLDASFPEYLRRNRSRYSHLIFPLSDDYCRRVRWARFWRTLQGRWIRFAEWLCPPALHNRLHLLKLKLRRR